MNLPKKLRGNSWFWGLLKDGENGAQLAKRLPYLPDDIDPEDVVIWTKVTTGRRPLAIVGVHIDMQLKVFGAVLDGLTVIQEAPHV